MKYWRALQAAVGVIQQQYSISFLWEHAGFISITSGKLPRLGVTLHLFPKPSCWYWGYSSDWHDGPLFYFGLGPFGLFCGEGWPLGESNDE